MRHSYSKSSVVGRNPVSDHSFDIAFPLALRDPKSGCIHSLGGVCTQFFAGLALTSKTVIERLLGKDFVYDHSQNPQMTPVSVEGQELELVVMDYWGETTVSHVLLSSETTLVFIQLTERYQQASNELPLFTPPFSVRPFADQTLVFGASLTNDKQKMPWKVRLGQEISIHQAFIERGQQGMEFAFKTFVELSPKSFDGGPIIDPKDRSIVGIACVPKYLKATEMSLIGFEPIMNIDITVTGLPIGDPTFSVPTMTFAELINLRSEYFNTFKDAA